MKGFAFIFVTIFVVIGTRSEDPDVTTTEVSVSADEVTTESETPGGVGQLDVYDRIEDNPWICFAMRTALQLAGYMENGVLNGSRADEAVDLFEKIGVTGLISERAENCTEKANLETRECAVITTFVRCVHGNKNGTETDNED